jgi:hypothetical protein
MPDSLKQIIVTFVDIGKALIKLDFGKSSVIVNVFIWLLFVVIETSIPKWFDRYGHTCNNLGLPDKRI